jgi:viologen exporter family transport system permease protein
VADARVYAALVRAGIAGQTTYRASFAVEVLGTAFGVGLDFVEVFAVFGQVPTIGGLTFAEVVLVFAIASIGFALADLLVGQSDAVIQHVRAGTFDVVLLRPLSVLGQLAAADLQLRRLGRVAVSLVLLGVVLTRLDIDWTPARVAMLAIAPVAATVVFGSLFVVAGAVSFFVVEGTEVTSALTYGSAYLAQWPTPVLAPVLARFFTFVVPAAFTGYLPALAILGRSDPSGLPDWLPWASPLAALLAATAAGLLWRSGIRHYVGAGG